MSVFIKYRLATSAIHGIGCFAAEEIKSGTRIAQASPMDVNLTLSEFSKLPENEQSEIRHHGHFDKVSNKWHVDFDMTRFANHSDTPNIQQQYEGDDYFIIALRDINANEELLINYSDFERNHDSRGF